MAEKLPLPSPLIYHGPNHILLPRRRRSHAIITPYGRRQKNGENKLRLRDFTVLTLTIFSIKLLFPGPSRDRWYLNLQTDFYPAAYSDRFCLLQSRRDENRTVRNDWVLDIFQFFCSPFFQLHCYFRGRRVICDIAVHSPIFAPPPPPPAHIYWNRAATQKNGEKPLCSNDFSVHPLTFFSIKLLFFGLSRDPGYLSSQLDFCPAGPTTRSRVLQQSGNVKIMVRIHFVLTILQFVCSRFFN